MKMRLLCAGVAGVAVAVLCSGGRVWGETPQERGAYLVNSIVACGNCHTPGTFVGKPERDRELAGGNKFDEKPFTAYASNITPDKETGIGTWTDEQIIRAIREGRRPDGSLIGPPMPFEQYRGISDRDVRAIVAYLRSVKPVRHKVPRSVYRMKLPPAYGPPVGSVPEVPRSDKVRYGAYLAGPLGHCVECHTPMDPKHPGRFDYANALGAGGFMFRGPWGVSFSANITPDKKTGIGSWTDSQIIAAITKGIAPDGRRLRSPMPYSYYHNIRRSDLEAIVAYLRSLTPMRYGGGARGR